MKIKMFTLTLSKTQMLLNGTIRAMINIKNNEYAKAELLYFKYLCNSSDDE